MMALPATPPGAIGRRIGQSRPGVRCEYKTEMIDLETASDATLVVAIARWHEAAMAEAYRRHGGAVYALAHRVIRETSSAEEITQEIFLGLWQHPEKLDYESRNATIVSLASAPMGNLWT